MPPSIKEFTQSALSALVEFGKGGPKLKANAGVFEARNNADNAYAILRGAAPSGGNDLVTKTFLESQALSYNKAAKVSFVFGDFGGGTKNSTVVIPNADTIYRVNIRVNSVFDAGATLKVGIAGTPALLMDDADSDLSALGNQGGVVYETWTAASTLLLTFTGAPTTGTGVVIVEYGTPAS